MINDKVCFSNNNKEQITIINNKAYIYNRTYMNNIPLELLGIGVDGVVYKYKDKAIKLYHDNKYVKEHLTKEQINILTTYNTKHIVLPKESLTSTDINPGFIMNYINLEQEKDLSIEPKKVIINEIKEMEQELMFLGQNHFLLNDSNTDNLFYNGNLYLFDPDSFLYDAKANFTRRNIEIFVWYFIRDIIFSLKNGYSKQEQLANIRRLNYLYKKGDYQFLSNLLENLPEDENLNQAANNFINKKLKR